MPGPISAISSLPCAGSEIFVHYPPHSGVNMNQAELKGVNHTLWGIVAGFFEVPPPSQLPSVAFGGFANQEHTTFQNVNSNAAVSAWEALRLEEENRVLSRIINYCMQQGAARAHMPVNGNYGRN